MSGIVICSRWGWGYATDHEGRVRWVPNAAHATPHDSEADAIRWLIERAGPAPHEMLSDVSYAPVLDGLAARLQLVVDEFGERELDATSEEARAWKQARGILIGTLVDHQLEREQQEASAVVALARALAETQRELDARRAAVTRLEADLAAERDDARLTREGGARVRRELQDLKEELRRARGLGVPPEEPR